METSAPSASEFAELLATELSHMHSPGRRAFIQALLIEPYRSQLEWEYGSNEAFEAWTFADLKERNVVAQYCRGGHGGHGCPWGINFRTATHFGQDCGWYPGLDALAADWGIPE